MKIFVAAAFSAKADYTTGTLDAPYVEWVKSILKQIKDSGNEYYCSLEVDNFVVNNTDPVAAFNNDLEHVESCDVFLALLDETVSTGVQTEMGYAMAKGKNVYVAHDADVPLAWVNKTLVSSGRIAELTYPLDIAKIV